MLVSFAHKLLLSCLSLVHLILAGTVKSQISFIIVRTKNVRVCFKLSFHLRV
jgi:hypothetical protein